MKIHFGNLKKIFTSKPVVDEVFIKKIEHPLPTVKVTDLKRKDVMNVKNTNTKGKVKKIKYKSTRRED